MKITFPDGSIREFNEGISAFDVAEAISPRLRKATIACEVNGERADAFAPLTQDCTLKLLTFADEGGRWAYRHTASHMLAQAVKRLYPDVKLAIGPAIENGFYYDFDAPEPFSPTDLEAIEKEIAKIEKENFKLERFELPRAEAIAYMEERGEPYKVELIRDLPEDAVISFYRQGEFVDLCAGPHAESTGKIKNVKLMNVAGAYWRGSEKNKMLQRIYGTAFEKKADLDEYVAQVEEAKKRDHNKLGRELEYFTTVDVIGQGFPFCCLRARAPSSFCSAGLRMKSRSAAICSPRRRLWQRATFTRFPATGITTGTACLCWATRKMKPRSASLFGR